MLPETLCWKKDCLELLDQRRLPEEVCYLKCTSAEEVAQAIEQMVVRGAPAIGIAAAYGVALEGKRGVKAAKKAISRLSKTRPTAVNLYWALKRAEKETDQAGSDLGARLEELASRIHKEDVLINRRIGFHGQGLLPHRCTVLTHCNAGALATGGYGTALGVIRAAREAGKHVERVYVDETRPLFQGGRLTSWELLQDGFEVTVLCDDMASFLMKTRPIDAVIVGADRVAANGDVANKIGTYHLAIAARYHRIPFYVAAPRSTLDPSVSSGEGIPIEERDPQEVRMCGSRSVVAKGAAVWNPAFDVTPSILVDGIITEVGILRPPYERAIKEMPEPEQEGDVAERSALDENV